ncbi:MAG: hypothetical protein ABW026_08755 [Microvirga sp.]
MTADETEALAERDILVPDPNSVLVSRHVELGAGAVLWPGTILRVTAGRLAIGEGTQCYPGTRVEVTGGSVSIGSEAEIGEEGGFTIKADGGSVIAIGDGARILGGGSLSGSNRIGAGGQILGAIRCRDCHLGDGGHYREPDPGLRGGVLKGFGVARGLEVPTGHVIQGFGDFATALLRHQTYFHPEFRSP